MNLPLEGIKILDMTKALAGPFATMILADMGAEVIKVEVPGRGDDTRGMGPYINGESGYFISVNRNKKGITLDMKNPQSKQVLTDLIQYADVIVENFKPGTMEKFGFGYEDIVKFKPEIVYAACSGFGHTGPYKYKPAFDIIVQAAGGIMSITGEEGGSPTRVGASIGDTTAGLYTAIGILGACMELKRTGRGQKVDISMLDCQVATLENAIIRYTSSGEIPMPKGNRHPSSTPFEPFICKDRDTVVIAIGNDLLWKKFCGFNGHPELLEDEKLLNNNLRTVNYPYTKALMDQIMAEKTSDEWIKLFEENQVPITRLNNIAQLVSDPQVQARGMIAETRHPIAGIVRTAASPLNFSLVSQKPNRPAPVLGQDTINVLHDILGYDDAKIAALHESHVF